jgi:anti-sigma factor RsiW
MTHLSDEQFANCLASGENTAAREHLESCAECHAQLSAISGLITQAKSAAAPASAPPAAFWARQRAAILGSARNRHSQWQAWSVAAAFAVLLLASTVLLRTSRPQLPPDRAATTRISDDALLSAVHDTLQQQVPEALEPAQLLVNEQPMAATTDTNLPAITRR